jgi:hypothetical protein
MKAAEIQSCSVKSGEFSFDIESEGVQRIRVHILGLVNLVVNSDSIMHLPLDYNGIFPPLLLVSLMT